jgi:hypothetical protein
MLICGGERVKPFTPNKQGAVSLGARLNRNFCSRLATKRKRLILAKFSPGHFLRPEKQKNLHLKDIVMHGRVKLVSASNLCANML